MANYKLYCLDLANRLLLEMSTKVANKKTRRTQISAKTDTVRIRNRDPNDFLNLMGNFLKDTLIL